MFGWAAVLTAMLVVSACGSGSDSFVRNVAAPDFDEPGSFTDFGQYNGEVDYMDHDFKLAAPDEYPSPGDKWLGEKYLSPSFECKSDRLTVSMNAKTDVPVTEEQLALLDIELDETFSDFALARYKYNGKPESYFGDDGVVVTDVGLQSFGFPDGPWLPGFKIVDQVKPGLGSVDVFKNTSGLLLTESHIYVWGRNNAQAKVLRYTSSGLLDTSFAAGGIFTLLSGREALIALAVDEQGRIVMVGGTSVFVTNYATYGEGPAWLMRLDANGDPDGSLGEGIELEHDAIFDVALQKEKIVVAARTENASLASGFSFGLYRYNSDGSKDDTFTDAFADFGLDLSDAHLLVAGEFIYLVRAAPGHVKVYRLLSDGQLDLNWGDGGVAATTSSSPRGRFTIFPSPLGGVDVYVTNHANENYLSNVQGTPPVTITRFDANGSAIDQQSFVVGPEGEPLGVGLPHLGGHFVLYGEHEDTTIIRVTSTGEVDSSYTGTFSDDLEFIRFQNMESLPDGGVVGRGEISETDTVALVKIDSEGNVDPSLGFKDAYRTPDRIADVTINGGRVFVVGNSQVEIGGSPKRLWGVASYKINGDLDQGFGELGVATKIMSDTSSARALAIDSDGLIYVAGSDDNKLALVRYQTNGALDSEFGQEGIVKAAIAGRPSAANSVATGKDQQPVVAGYVELGNRRYPALQRYTTAGSLDTGFGYSGTSITKVGKSAEINDLVIQPNQSIVAVGHVETPTGTDVLVMRFKPNGVLDPSFGNKGKIIEDLGTNTDRAHAVALDRRGRILVTGVRGGSDSDFATLRYTSDGKLDESFDSDGLVTTDFGSPVEQATDIKVDANQRIVVSGTTGKDSDAVFAVARYRSNGSPDSQFDDDGRVTTDIGTGADHANGLVLLKGQLPIVVGSSIGVEWNELFPDYNVTIEGYFASAQKGGTKTTAQQADSTADQLTLDIMYSTGKTKTVFLHVVRDEDTAEFEGAVQTTMYVEFDGPPSNRTCAVSMNFASTYQQPWK